MDQFNAKKEWKDLKDSECDLDGYREHMSYYQSHFESQAIWRTGLAIIFFIAALVMYFIETDLIAIISVLFIAAYFQLQANHYTHNVNLLRAIWAIGLIANNGKNVEY